MRTQKTELFEHISKQGWVLTEVADWEANWWADEIWLLESTWSPVGNQAYLTFLVDPMIEDWQHRKKGESVWAVAIYQSKPIDRLTAKSSFLMSLNKGWQKELPEFLKRLSLLRDQSKKP